MAVATLAQLALLSTAHKDFALKPPANGFKFVRYPDSFKACLMQVCNEGWKAFNLAHTAMDEIRLSTLNIPGDMKKAVNILLNGSDHEVKVMLPKVLMSIETVAETCDERSTDVVKKYVCVLDLIGELLETGMSTKGANEKIKTDLENQRHDVERKKVFLEEEKMSAEKMRNQAEELFKKSTKGNV